MGIITLDRKKIFNFLLCLALFGSFASVKAQCPTVTNPTQSFCDTQNPTIASLVATNNGGGIRWYATATTPAANFLSPTSPLTDGEDYFADDNSGACGTRQAVVVSVYTKPSVIAQQQGFCEESTVSDLQATGNMIQWYLAATGGTALAPSTILLNNTFYWASQTNPNTGCETSRQRVFVTIRILATPVGPAEQHFCSTGSPTISNLQATASGTIIWYPSPSSGFELAPATPLADGQTYYAANSDDLCESGQRLAVTVVFDTPNNAGSNGSRNICISQVPTTAPFNLFTLLGGSPSSTGVWTGPIPTTNGNLGTVDVSSTTVAGSPYVFTYTVSGNACPAATSTVTITILPLPVVTIAATTTICSGSSATVTFTGTPNATVTYNINGGASQTIVLNAAGTATITNTYTATTIFNLVSVASATTPSCSQTQTGSITITVLPLPTATIASDVTVCPNGSATVTFTGTANATVTYTINGGSNQTIVLNAAGTATITNTYAATAVFTLVSISSSSTPVCTTPLTGTVTVTVRPLPTVTISGTTNVCPNGSATITFTGTPNAIVTYTVNSGPNQTITLSAAGTATISNTFAVNTTYTLISVVTAGTPACSQPQTGSVTITVLPLPTATIAASATICSGSSTTVTFTGTPNATVTYTINGGTNQTIVLNAAGTATLTNTYTTTSIFNLVSASSGTTPSCSQPVTGTITITVRPLPTVTINGNVTICPNSSATVTFTGTPNAIVTYNINGGASQTITLNAAGTATITNTYAATAIFNIVSVATGGTPNCTQPQTGTVTVTVTPLPTVTISGTASVCPNGTATITFTGTPNATVTYTVNNGPNQTIVLSGGGTATITGPYTVTTVFTLVSIATAGTPSCTRPVTGSATITVTPLPTVTIASNTTICIGGSATVTFTGTPNAIVTYNINGGANQTITLNAAGTAAITNTYSATAIFNLVSVATSGTPSCSQLQTGTVTITVVPPPTVTISANATICSGGTAVVTFTGTPNATVTYNINGGASQTIVLNATGTATISNTYTATTIFNLVSILSSGTPGCSQPQTGSITITVIPPPTVTIAANTTICSGQSATVTFTGTANAIVTYTVNGGANQTITLNASGSAAITNTYTTTTVINLVGIATSGTPSCTRPVTGTVTITVLPLPVGTIASTTGTICSGSIGTVTFTGTPNAIVTYTINGGSNQTITLNAAGTATLSNTYTTTAIFNLVSVATTGTPGCSQPQTGTVTITVIPPPTVSITSSAATICSGGSATVTFTGAPNATVTYTLNGGPNQTIVLNASGTATITNTYTANAIFTLVSIATSGTPVCTLPLTATLTVTVIPPPTVTIASDVTICTGQSATVTFTGTPNATVSYTINGGSNQTIVLNATGTATVVNTYTANALFALVSVATSGTPSCSQLQTGAVTITVLPVPIASISGNATICAGSSATVTFAGTPNASITYTINGGTSQTIVLDASGNATLTNTYTATAIFNLVSVTSAGTPGCVQPVTGTITITVIPMPTVTIASSATICFGASATVTFTGTPNAVVTYTIDGSSNLTITLDATGTASITNTYTTTTVFTLVDVTIPGTPSCSQQQTGTVTITVEPVPFATISGDAAVCAGEDTTITFAGTPNATVTYNDGTADQTIVLNASGTATITISFSTTTTFTLISVTTAGTPGCTQTQTGNVTINVSPLPTVSIVANTNVCLGQASNITFNGTPNSIVTYNIDGGTSQLVTLDATGTATVTLTFTVNTIINLLSIETAGTPACVRPLTDAIAITVNPLPTVSITGGATICAGSITPIQFTGTPNTIVTYTINNGANQFINIGASGTVTLNAPYTITSIFNLVSVALSNPPSCSQPQTGTVTVTVVQPPNAGSNAVLPLCGNSAPQDLFLLLGSTAQTGGTWSPALASGTGIFDPAVDNSGTYTYTVVGTPPCVNDTASATVTVTPQTDAGIDGAASLCSNADPVDLITFLGGTPQTGGTWSPALPSGTGVFNPNSDPAGVYTYTIIGVAPCVDDSSTVTVSVTPGPDAGISGSAAFCVNSAPQDLFLSLGGTPQVGGTWSPTLASGTGVFNPAVDTAGVYTYTFSGNQPCDDDTATVTVTVSPIPDAGQDGTAIFCSNYAPSDLFANLGGTPQTGGTWSPALASGTGVFNPLVDAPGTYTYTVGGALCSTDSADVVVTVFQSPNAGGLNATLLINTCQTFNAIDLFTGLNGSQGVGIWNDDDATGALAGNIFNPSIVGPGTYHFTYTVSGGISPCLTDSATVTVVVQSPPEAGTFTGIQSVCASVGTFDLLTVITGNQLGGVFTDGNNVPVDNPVDVSTLPGGTYSYLYTVTNACGSDSEFLQLTILPNPVLNLPDVSVSTPICVGQNAVVSFSNIADGTYTLNYDLSISNVLANQTATFTITDGAGSFEIDSANIPNTGITTVTFLNIASASTSCSSVIADVSANFEINPSSELIDSDLSIVNVCAGSDAIVTITNAAGLPDGDYEFAFNIPTGTPTTGTSGLVGIENGNGQFIIPASYISTAGNYTLTITTITGLSGGCDNLNENATANFQVQALPVLNPADISVSSPLCLAQNATVSFSNMADGDYTVNYDLSGGNVLSNQTATFTVVNGAGSFDIGSANIPNTGITTITILNIANAATSCASVIADASADFGIFSSSDLTDADLSISNVCAGSDATVIISNATGLADGDYQFGFTIPTGTPTTGTTATVTIANGNGQFIIPASYIATVGNYTFTIATITNLTSGCNNINENATASFQVQVLPNVTGASLSATAGCPNFSNQVSISGATNLPDGDYTIDYQLSGANTAAETVTVTFTSGSGSFTIPAADLANSGTVTVNVSQLAGVTSQCGLNGNIFTAINFEISQPAEPQINPKGNEFCGTDNPKPSIASLSANISGSDIIVWYNAAQGGTAYADSDLLIDGATYYAAAITSTGCESATRLAVTVDLDKCDEIIIPDGFSPNGDGINDAFTIKNLRETYPNFKLEIYNRYGNILYKGNTNSPDWNGTTNEAGLKLGDSLLPVGVYFYIIEFNNGVREPKQGRVYLNR